MRISDSAKLYGIRIKPATVAVGAPVYRIKDIFTTRNGSWEPGQDSGSLPQWARETYLKAWGSINYFDDAGADHHLFGGVYNPATASMTSPAIIHYWTWTDDANHVDVHVKDKSGWANIPITNTMYPDQGQTGAWAWSPKIGNVPADVIEGGGLPYNQHISWFATWVLESGAVVVPPVEPPAQDARIAKLETWARAISAKYPGGPQYDLG